MTPAAQLQILRLAQDLAPRLTEMRRHLHRHPELSHEEYWTTQQIRSWLDEAGIEILPLDLNTGVVAEIRGTRPGPTIAIRTDIDALPVPEQTGLAFASEVPGKMHACGHDFHCSSIMGAALILQGLRHEMAGSVRIFFQPAEETASGAVELIKAGAMAGVQAIFGLHNKPDLAAGHVGIKHGALMASTDTIKITIEGKGGHAAIPEATVDPIVVGSAVVMALQSIVSRSVSPHDAAVVTIGSFQGGAVHNVIPGIVTLIGTVRNNNPVVRARMPQLIGRVIEGVAVGYGAKAVLEWTPGTPSVQNDLEMCEVMRRAAVALDMPVEEALPTMGGEDFAEYQQLAPGCFIWLGTGCVENWHHPCFMVDESVLPKASALMAQVALEALSHLVG